MGDAGDSQSRLFESFAEAIVSFEKLTNIGAKFAAVVENSVVPWKETRKLLKCMNPDQISNTSLFQFMQDLFIQIGFGRLEIADVNRFELTFHIKKCQVCELYRIRKGSKICVITSDAILKFFVKDLDMPCSVEETKCVNDGNDSCEFKVDLQPLGVYKIALDDIDRDLIYVIMNETFDVEKFAKENKMEEETVDYRLQVLKSYQLIDDDGKVTEIGSTYHKFAQGLRALEEDFDPPWKNLSDVTSAIAAKDSFAEAMSEVLNPEPFITVDALEVVDLALEAKKSKSFAELITKYMKQAE